MAVSKAVIAGIAVRDAEKRFTSNDNESKMQVAFKYVCIFFALDLLYSSFIFPVKIMK